jgi:hypothetical protein
MLNYKKKTQPDNESVLRDQRKDIQQLKMSDISKIEQGEDFNEHPDIQKTKNGLKYGSKVASEHMLNMGMDQRHIDRQNFDHQSFDHQSFDHQSFDHQSLDPLSIVRGLKPEINSMVGTINHNGPYAMGNPMMGQQNMINQLNPSNPNYVINIQQTVDKDSIIVETNYNQKKFLFYDRNKNFLGGFSSHDFIRFITSHVSSNFLRGVDSDSAKTIIEKYICKVSVVEKPSKRYIISMLNYFESPFMGNIESLIKFYTFIHEFEDNLLQKELDSLNIDESVKTKEIFDNMMYTLLNHILKIIAALTNKLNATDANTSKIRDSLLNYSVAIVYRLSKFVRHEIDIKVDELTILNHDLLRIEGIRTGLSSKLDSVQRSIDKQNAEIDVVLRNILMFQMATKSSSTNTNKDSENDDMLDALEETLDQDSDDNMNTENAPKTISSEKIRSSRDKSNIFNENSESGRSTLPSKYKLTQQSDSLRISELLNEVGKLKTISEKRSSDVHKKSSDQSDILFMTKHKKTGNMDRFNHVKTSYPQELVSHSQGLSSGFAKSLSDILSIHGNINYGADESANSFNINEDGGTDLQLKHLSTPSNPKLSIIDIE